ncbi:MAG: AbgT family transporter [Gammaproteobacteria bacterium]|jgi:aminobenzoyl-glutamate transport protein|nr:AbgT family transporter [Gammaproteobacteria bacterium]MDH3756604.1 AbgT family transporter [Gammaproteobacteria bacterium]MDH3846547.1 AbgT family transporter [Gammaproteobacteria bacterium]MDH3862342.1 AbgT family transporter [Gammaproteobacteria bacterium]MDH3904005.1 AbgT family transporter [Gammaproteobacteria bacterium]
MSEQQQDQAAKTDLTTRILRNVERVGNALPDPAVLFIALLFVVWIMSWLLSYVTFDVFHPATGDRILIINQLSGESFVQFMSTMVTRFVTFGPIGVVLVAMLGIGVAEHAGFIDTSIRALLNVTAKWLLTPMVIIVGIVSHAAVDAGYVLVIPLGGVIFYAAGRHPLAGIAAAFAGVSGGFSANFVPSSLDPLLQGLTQEGARLLDPDIAVNTLNNYFFTTASSILIVALGWWLTDRVVEPRLQGVEIDGDADDLPEMHELQDNERKGLRWSLTAMVLGLVILFISVYPDDSAWRDAEGGIATNNAPIMKSIVSLIFFLFIIPGIIYGKVSGSMRGTRDMIEGMTKAMHNMAYYIVIMFFIAQFVIAFSVSNLGTLLAISGAELLKAMGLPTAIMIVGIVLLTAFVNIFVGSASGKWGLLAPIFVPMLMTLGISPDLTQAAYRVGDSSTNIITPLMPYFPLVVIYCQRYVKNTGIGTLAAMMLPYSVWFLICWTVFLLVYYAIGLPLGFASSYTYP